MPQLSLFDQQRTLQERFDLWIEANGHIYEAFKATARKLRAAGRTHYGAKGICEYLRFHSALESEGDPYKINNVYVSRLARKLIDEDPTFVDFFEQRSLKSE